ncbi:MAG: hypothetical protein U0165_19500 [Polyangiaceae bacterium]
MADKIEALSPSFAALELHVVEEVTLLCDRVDTVSVALLEMSSLSSSLPAPSDTHDRVRLSRRQHRSRQRRRA